MASVNVSDDEFFWMADAANRAADRGAREAAEGLDKLARKISAALSVAKTTRLVGQFGRMFKGHTFTWKEVPSVLR